MDISFQPLFLWNLSSTNDTPSWTLLQIITLELDFSFCSSNRRTGVSVSFFWLCIYFFIVSCFVPIVNFSWYSLWFYSRIAVRVLARSICCIEQYSIKQGLKKWIATETNHSIPIHYNFSYTILHVIKSHPNLTIRSSLPSHRRNTWNRYVISAKLHTLPSVALPSYHPHIQDEICWSTL